MTETLIDHTSQHSLETISIAISVLPHLLQRDANAHLAIHDSDRSIEEVKIRQLAVDAVIDDVDLFEAVVECVINNDDSLKGTALERQRPDSIGRVRIVIGIYPGLWTCPTFTGDEEDDILRP